MKKWDHAAFRIELNLEPESKKIATECLNLVPDAAAQRIDPPFLGSLISFILLYKAHLELQFFFFSDTSIAAYWIRKCKPTQGVLHTISGGRVFSSTKSTLLLTLKTPQTISSSHTREFTNIELTNIDVGDDDATQSKSKTPRNSTEDVSTKDE